MNAVVETACPESWVSLSWPAALVIGVCALAAAYAIGKICDMVRSRWNV